MTPKLTKVPKEFEAKRHQSLVGPSLQNQVNEPDAGLLSRVFSRTPGEPPANGASQLRRSPMFSHPANHPLRAAALQRAQQTHGNRFVQRLIATTQENHNEVSPAGSGSQPLDAAMRNFMESRFGTDLGDVRVHTDARAGESATALGANAYASGRDIYFAAGQYAPSTQSGRRLLAHELVHTVQQGARDPALSPMALISLTEETREGEEGEEVQPKLVVSQPHDPDEQEAERISEVVASPAPAGFNPGGSAVKAGETTCPECEEKQVQPKDRPRSAPQDIRLVHRQTVQRQAQPSGGGGVTGMPNLGSSKLKSGTMQWSLVPMPGYVNARIEFTPNPTVAAASKTISFVQTVSENITSGGFLGLGSTTSYGNTGVDVLPGESDPFYGAKWNQKTGKWGDEPGSTQVRPGDYQGQGGVREGSRPFTASTSSAILNDSPMLQINMTKQFETAAVVLETGQVLGSLHWNVQRWRGGFFNETSSTIVQRADCTEDPSADFQSVAQKFYTSDGHFVVDGFAAGSADLPATHPQQLAPVLDRLRKEPNRRINVGGAASPDEANPTTLSQGRAEKVRAYLVGQGIAEARIDVEAYGSDWARVPVAAGTPSSNRRVQITML